MSAEKVIIFPLRAKLTPFLFGQQRPRSNAGRRVIVIRALPWAGTNRVGRNGIGFGRVDRPPILEANCWPGYGLAALRLTAQVKSSERISAVAPNRPAVVHRLPCNVPVTWPVFEGVTRNSAGAPLANCMVELFDTVSDLVIDRVTSDGTGAFAFRSTRKDGRTYYLVSYKVGSPDVAGTTANNLIPI